MVTPPFNGTIRDGTWQWLIYNHRIRIVIMGSNITALTFQISEAKSGGLGGSGRSPETDAHRSLKRVAACHVMYGGGLQLGSWRSCVHIRCLWYRETNLSDCNTWVKCWRMVYGRHGLRSARSWGDVKGATSLYGRTELAVVSLAPKRPPHGATKTTCRGDAR